MYVYNVAERGVDVKLLEARRRTNSDRVQLVPSTNRQRPFIAIKQTMVTTRRRAPGFNQVLWRLAFWDNRLDPFASRRKHAQSLSVFLYTQTSA